MRTISPLRILTLALSLVPGSLALAQDYSWNSPHAEVLPAGDLKWQPRAFAFQAGRTTRYIDYRDGDDDNPGTRAQPWKHHPWDANATGRADQANGPITYVFKRGVVYRGQLVADESGSEKEPIRLTSDPDWGEGKAMLWGSKDLTGAIDFLRVCQGTLEDARTDIEELYAWQTRGPVTRDFCGNEPKGRRDIGAIERVD